MSQVVQKKKEHVALAFVGNTNCGKSTLLGRLFYDLKYTNKRRLNKFLKLAQISEQIIGNKSSKFGFFMDNLKYERWMKLTLTYKFKQLITSFYDFTVIDTPGNIKYIRNIIAGISLADVGILVVSVNDIDSKYKLYVQLCYILGIRQFIICINKMDNVKFSQQKYFQIKQKLEKIVNKIGYKSNKIAFIPICGFDGDNLVTKSANMKWYKGFNVKIKNKNIFGYTLMDALEKVIKPKKHKRNKPFIMQTLNVHRISGVGDVVDGRIIQGKILTHHNVVFYPSGVKARVFSIEKYHRLVNEGKAGEFVGIHIKGLRRDNMPEYGEVVCIDDMNYNNFNRPFPIKTFSALIFVSNRPGKLKSCIDPTKNKFKYGYKATIICRNTRQNCTLTKINWKSNKSSNHKKIYNPTYIESGDTAEVVFSPQNINWKYFRHSPLTLYPENECKAFSRILAFENNQLVIVGKVISVKYIWDLSDNTLNKNNVLLVLSNIIRNWEINRNNKSNISNKWINDFNLLIISYMFGKPLIDGKKTVLLSLNTIFRSTNFGIKNNTITCHSYAYSYYYRPNYRSFDKMKIALNSVIKSYNINQNNHLQLKVKHMSKLYNWRLFFYICINNNLDSTNFVLTFKKDGIFINNENLSVIILKSSDILDFYINLYKQNPIGKLFINAKFIASFEKHFSYINEETNHERFIVVEIWDTQFEIEFTKFDNK